MVSVIIATKDRQHLAQRLISALLKQGQAHEIIVVEAVSGLLLAEFCLRHPSVIYKRAKANPAHQRNVGAALASADILLFLDDDVEPGLGLIQAHADMYRDPTVVAAAVPSFFEGPEDWFVRALRGVGLLSPFWWSDTSVGEFEWTMTMNLSVRRSAFEDVGGFDAVSFPKNAGEDVDICWRLRQLGKLVATDASWVCHTTETFMGLKNFARRYWNYGRSATVLAEKYPARTHFDLLPLEQALLVGLLFLGLAGWWGLAAFLVCVLGQALALTLFRGKWHGVVMMLLLWQDAAALYEAIRRRFPPWRHVDLMAESGAYLLPSYIATILVLVGGLWLWL